MSLEKSLKSISAERLIGEYIGAMENPALTDELEHDEIPAEYTALNELLKQIHQRVGKLIAENPNTFAEYGEEISHDEAVSRAGAFITGVSVTLNTLIQYAENEAMEARLNL